MMTRSQHLHVPALNPEDVIRHLGKGLRHWKEGRSAYSLAKAWFGTDYPQKIRTLLDKSEGFRGAELVDAFFERNTHLGDAHEPSHTDLLTIARLANKLAVIGIEGKADEPFGPLINEWLDDGGVGSAREERLRRLSAMLGLKSVRGELRWQLFHRTIAVALEAKRYCTNTALLIVHSFDPRNIGINDYRNFIEALGIDPEPVSSSIVGPTTCEIGDQKISVFFGWASDAPHLGEFWNGLQAHAVTTSR